MTSPAVLRLDPPSDHPLFRIQPALSPYAERIEAAILSWADRYDVLDDPRARRRLAKTRLGELIARAYPTIEADRIVPVAGWFTWAFVIDDCFAGPVGDYDAVCARILAVLGKDGQSGPAVTRLDALLGEVWECLAVGRSRAWRDRFILHMSQFLAAFKYEALNREHGHTPHQLQYTQLRRASGGITPSLDLAEVVAGQEVLPLLLESEPLVAMYNRASDVVVWVNDIVSLPKELAAGETTNGVLVLARTHGVGHQDAVAIAWELVAEQVAQFDAAQREFEELIDAWFGLTSAEVATASAFVAGMRSWMRGNLDWSHHTDRYLIADGMRLSTDAGLVRP
ncbi:terpene synthase family protein [Kribbella solani]|uniref:Terpene synthase n=1 Tax=Kribbella solani TaxID=236067 RepID=A0A841DXE3_9ACTN|nr:hypothetical protein [Kribbella solani]MBB5979898.1 hypothetical protein [Kribbella solani]MDX2973532.1 hypothetical protein [Kribbella solani]MDX3004811.1 hypothetical protein [Kribbella solani]